MKGAAWAGEALADLDERGARSRIVRELVRRAATGMAEEMRREEVMPKPLVLTFRRGDR
jgi:hypothetical protein